MISDVEEEKNYDIVSIDSQPKRGVIMSSENTLPPLPDDVKREWFSGPVIRYDLMRSNKSLSDLTAADVPPGFDWGDVCSLESLTE